MKIRLIEGEPASILSGPFLRLDLSTHDAVVVIKDKATLPELAQALSENPKSTEEKPNENHRVHSD